MLATAATVVGAGARLLSLYASPAARTAGGIAAVAVTVRGASEAVTKVSDLRRRTRERVEAEAPVNVAETPAEPTATGKVAENYQRVRTQWKASTRKQKRQMVAKTVRTTTGRVVRVVTRAPRVIVRVIKAAFFWTTDTLYLSIVTVAFAAVVLVYALATAVNSVLNFTVGFAVGLLSAGLVYLMARPFSSREDALRVTRRAFTAWDRNSIRFQRLLDRFSEVSTRGLSKASEHVPFRRQAVAPEVVETTATSDEVHEATGATAASEVPGAQAHNIKLNINPAEIQRSAFAFGQKVFNDNTDAPEEIQQEVFERMSEGIRSSGLSEQHRVNAEQGWKQAKARFEQMRSVS